MTIMIVNAATGETIERDRTVEEQAQHDADVAEAKAQAAEDAAKAQADAEARDAAVAHAKSLGFTDSMISVMYPNLGAQNG
jgi:hypothetical protein